MERNYTAFSLMFPKRCTWAVFSVFPSNNEIGMVMFFPPGVRLPFCITSLGQILMGYY